ncbi:MULTISPECIES: hypothetical protein [unclassified Rickettsia]|uniref:hypothetical protein n=1 Tax=unclassified Rickettsia TaxID=114295 RepID=UPI0031332A90
MLALSLAALKPSLALERLIPLFELPPLPLPPAPTWLSLLLPIADISEAEPLLFEGW